MTAKINNGHLFSARRLLLLTYIASTGRNIAAVVAITYHASLATSEVSRNVSHLNNITERARIPRVGIRRRGDGHAAFALGRRGDLKTTGVCTWRPLSEKGRSLSLKTENLRVFDSQTLITLYNPPKKICLDFENLWSFQKRFRVFEKASTTGLSKIGLVAVSCQ